RPRPPTALPKSPPLSRWKLGVIFALLSSASFSLQNVLVRVILFPSTLLGVFQVGGIISPSFGNSIFILWLRMLVVVPLVALLGTEIYDLNQQPFWSEITRFLRADNATAKLKVIGSGFFLFLSQTLAYVAFGGMAAGVVTTLILTYPIVTLLLARVFFQERLTPFRLIVSLVVFLGVALIALPFDSAIQFSTLSVVTALGSGISLAICVILAQMCFKYINPSAFTLVQFGVIFVFAGLFSLYFGNVPGGIQVQPGTFSLLLLAGIALGLTSLASYLFQNLGIRWAGAASFSIVANTGPVMTSLMAFLLIGETLQGTQLGGMLLVTAGVVALGVKRLSDERAKQRA
ncbi:MAG: DMT family transporter, partial [Spirulinaceae cyanobacterium RM2_2_10]|nr:DMT family transporter [Spirulinaceae cyanobacterium RM2_2_10]